MTKRRKKSLEAGVLLQEELAIKYPKRKYYTWLLPCLEVLLLFALTYASMMGFVKGFEIEIRQNLYTGVILFLSILFYGSFSFKKKMEWCLLVEILLYGWGSYVLRNKIASGFAIVTNTVLELAGEYYKLDFPKYVVESKEPVTDITIFLIFFSVFLVGSLAYFIRNKLAHVVVLGVTVALAFSPEVVGRIPTKKYLLIYAISILSYLGSNVAFGELSGRKQKVVKWMQVKVQLFQVMMGILALCFVTNSFTETTYQELVKDKSLKQAVQNVIKREYNNLIGKYVKSGAANGGINFGKVGKATAIEYTGEEKLRITWNAYPNGSLYLRGYVGSVYSGKSWEPLEEKSMKACRNLEKHTGIPVEDYASAGMYYNYAYASTRSRELYNQFPPLNYQQFQIKQFHDGTVFGKKYSKQQALESLENVENILDQLQVENVGESFSTVFMPYYALGAVREDEGKFDHDKVGDVGQYTWYISPDFQQYFYLPYGVLNSNAEGGGNKLDLFWWELRKEIGVWENILGISVFDYKKGNYQGKTVAEVYEHATGKSQDLFLDFLEDKEINCYSELDADSYFLFLKYAYEFYIQQQDYKKFVYETYTQVPEAVSENIKTLIKKNFDKYDGTTEALTLAIGDVQDYLKNETTYTLHPGSLPEGEEFVSYFLLKSKTGYCVHYASAATVIFRSLGIPARYVEGYLATKQQLRDSYQGEERESSLKLTDRNAHAWVEVYVEGYGWLPVEVTKGYTNGGIPKEENEKVPTTVPSVSKQPQATKTPSETQSENEQQQGLQTPMKKGVDWEKYIPFVKWIVGFLMVCLAVYGRKKLVECYRRKKEEHPDANQRAAYCYSQIEKLLRVQRMCKKEEELRELIEHGSIVISNISDREWEMLLEVMNKYAFSPEGLSFSEAELVVQSYHRVRQFCYHQQSFLKRCYYEYIRCL